MWGPTPHSMTYFSRVVRYTGTFWEVKANVSYLPVFCPGPPRMNCKMICRWLLHELDLQVPKRGQVVNQVQLVLVLGLGTLIKR